MSTAKTSNDYQTLRRELDQVLAVLQTPDIDVDQAMQLYERGLKLVKALRAHLNQAENKLERLKLHAAKVGI